MTPTSPLWKGRLEIAGAGPAGDGALVGAPVGLALAPGELLGVVSGRRLGDGGIGVLFAVGVDSEHETRNRAPTAASRRDRARATQPYGPGQVTVRIAWLETANCG